jgi:agmatinase
MAGANMPTVSSFDLTGGERMRDERFYPPGNFASLDEEYAAYESARVVVLPVPYDSTTTARAGAREGPGAIIRASADMELFDVGIGYEPYRWGIHTLPELAPALGNAELTINRIEEVAGEQIDAGKFLVTLGGEHTVAVGPARAHAKRTPGLSVLAFDAHADMRDSYLDSKYNHACTLRRCSEVAPVTQIGLRSAEADEYAHIRERGFAYYPPQAFRRPGSAREIIDRLSDSVYITIDLDSFDPSQMSAVGTPEPGGLFWDEAVELLAEVAKARRIVGFDLTELAPDEGPRACAQMAAKLAYRLIGLALGPAGEG